MKNYVFLPFRFILYNISRKINKALTYPINYTYSVTRTCDSRCLTCSIWKSKDKKELSTSEWKKIILDIGKKPFWITITGGNQFLRNDLVKIFSYIKKYNDPAIINMPVSATIPKIIETKVKKILVILGKTKLILNISLDGTKKTHNHIRGKKGVFEKTLKTIALLKQLQKQFPNLVIGTYTTISRYNVKKIEKIIHLIKHDIKPVHFGFELAEIRNEYDNSHDGFSISKSDSLWVMKKISRTGDAKKVSPVIVFKNYLRQKYYKYVIRAIKYQKEIIPCYAGYSSVEISSEGQLWDCPNNTKSMGNLLNKSFNEIFFGTKADKIRKNIKKRKCFCTHSNPYYTNYLCELGLR
ncbi:MAG: radical SAM/SPASM domain-containing protein [Candidatus Woesearchaeota archaeon]